ncbi:hypothetical protein AYL99_05019 [Fonsecaea erecta]|uniref:Uncharacterized protein n=1 Tax=Fonsecaea erecta TaxID=1367422 RepID=A0A178ZJP7_9EURO|nr:hypothetical protein AYL99_05019 [Fonsecaea erecta]OAP60017.1 hypothetical protein AYL99_05019 [Fonsecaea erecta]
MSSSSKKVAIVTGGVSGIGAELTRKLISEGWRVAALDIPSQSHLAQKLSDELGDKFMFCQGDISRYQEQASAFSTVFQKWGRLDALCANAGIIDRSSIYILKWRGKTEIPPEPDLSCTDVCLKATIYGVQLAIHFMRQNPTPGGSIVATSSMVGVHPVASFPEYSGAKAGVNGFVRACAPYLQFKENITINTVCPGVVPTQFISQHMRDTFGEDSLTPASTIVGAYWKCLSDRSLNGEFIECSRDQHFILKRPEYADGEVSKRTTTVYDPYFVTIHGEPSGLPDIVRKRT